MENNPELHKRFSIVGIDHYKKKNKEVVFGFRNKDIELAFVDVDEQLAQLAKNYDNISKVRRLITIQQIRNRLFELCNLCVYGMNIRDFASHEPGDKTPVNSECC
jgi:hypothetical protein